MALAPKELTKDEQLAFLEANLRDAESKIVSFEPEYEDARRHMEQATSQLDYLQHRRDYFKTILATVAKS